ncbi:PaaI family thioesterase, partial [Aspergillus saccharolyticus JOP 1030-1]
EHRLQTHPLLLTLRNDASYTETRPHLSMVPAHRASHFVAGTLSGANKVTVPPYMFTRTKPSPTAQPTTQTAPALHAKEGGGAAAAAAAGNTPKTKGQVAQTVSLFHLGTTLNGHPGYVHGGLLSVMFDETFARCVAASFPSGVGMTANLSVDFRKPALPDRVYVLRAETVKVEGRKAWVEGTLTSLPNPDSPAAAGEGEEGTMVAEARALFIEPRFA